MNPNLSKTTPTRRMAVAQVLRYLQDANGGTIPEGFTIVAFDDLPAPRPQW